MKYSFNKAEKLTDLRVIKQLFESGKSFNAYPLKLIVTENKSDTDTPFKILIVAPKRNLNLAVHRNKVKRQLREAYRLNKSIIYSIDLNNKKYNLAFIYLAKTLVPYHQINEKTINLLHLFNKYHLKNVG